MKCDNCDGTGHLEDWSGRIQEFIRGAYFSSPEGDRNESLCMAINRLRCLVDTSTDHENEGYAVRVTLQE